MRLLLAEDEKALADALGAALKHNNYSVDIVYNGKDAVDYLAAGNYDALIMDIMMPVMDGVTALKEIRRSGNAIPVLLLTAKSEIEDRVEGLDAGADDYLTKPFAMSELMARVRAMTRRLGTSGAAPSDELRFGDLSLSRSTFEITSGGGSTRLGNKEFQMLEYMMRNPHMLISTEKFMEKIWGFDSDAEISVVWVYISYIRKKLSAVGSKVAIRAARGAGYSLEYDDA
ncbi:MAG: response regulator transcription factor [Ruminococcus sp.]|nr:response regulator transcription factor [Ruminococcus sp.]